MTWPKRPFVVFRQIFLSSPSETLAAGRATISAEIRQTSYLNRSLMPEGLLEAMPPEQVSDLFAYLKSLR
ncbi:MAG: hypothetical protein EXS41_06650 [Opitutaceae bacterium]|nr:hypothetical protein [Opitutaceae bacterium]